METESALYQLMGVRMNGIMNSITNSDGEYQKNHPEICRIFRQIERTGTAGRSPDAD